MSQPETMTIDTLARLILQRDRAALARALNLLDDRRAAARARAKELLELLQLAPNRVSGHLVGITGPPGVGKSTLSAALIQVWRRRNQHVGVLAVDPSSPVSGGALLGDRLRLQAAGDDDGVFIRSLSSRGHYGGLSAEVWPMAVLMHSAFDIVLIETVGVGQREIDISRLCDTTCFVAQPGSGDSIQSLKAGILEVPHILVVNKSDMGDIAVRAQSELESALVGDQSNARWAVPVLTTSATLGEGISDLADSIEKHHFFLSKEQLLAARRRECQAYWIVCRLREEFGEQGIERLGGHAKLTSELRSSQSSLFEQHDALRQRVM
ncbi:MAG: methylmalonyl Co-A mutase-associated GTPase MeaB [Halioglobus sp.]|nr:methylmalonyl Co-A mutase-associated GTPase MeaB [Halioglobus sp.]